MAILLAAGLKHLFAKDKPCGTCGRLLDGLTHVTGLLTATRSAAEGDRATTQSVFAVMKSRDQALAQAATTTLPPEKPVRSPDAEPLTFENPFALLNRDRVK